MSHDYQEFMFGRAREVLPPPQSTESDPAGTQRSPSLWPTSQDRIANRLTAVACAIYVAVLVAVLEGWL